MNVFYKTITIGLIIMAGLCGNNNAMDRQDHVVYSVEQTNELQNSVITVLDNLFEENDTRSALMAFIPEFCALCTRTTEYDTDTDEGLGKLFRDANGNVAYPSLAALFLRLTGNFRNKDSLLGFIHAIAEVKDQTDAEMRIIDKLNEQADASAQLLALIGEYCNAVIQNNSL